MCFCDGRLDRRETRKSLQPLEKQDRDKRASEDERMTEERRWRGREKERESERAREGGSLGFRCFLSDDAKHTMISVRLGFPS